MSRIKNPFYVGAIGMLTSTEQASSLPKYCQPTREAAIDKARKKLQADPSLDEVPIVQIVAIVKRGDMPIVVEEV